MRGGKRPSPSNWLLADYSLQHPDEVAFKTARELGESVGVSEATVIRFAHYLGYPGYPEFQRDCQRMLSDELQRARELKRKLVNGRGASAASDAPGAGQHAADRHEFAPGGRRRAGSEFAAQASQMIDSDVPLSGYDADSID